MRLELHSPHPIPVRTAVGNGEERAAQIQRIQERFTRLQHFSEHMNAEVEAMADDVQKLSDREPSAALDKAPTAH